MINDENTTLQILIDAAKHDKELPQQVREQKVHQLRNSILQMQTDSSFKVITSIANTMIGSSMIVFPILFVKDGMLGSLIIMLVLGIFLYFTCRLMLMHNRPDQVDFSQQIKRILGPKWATFNRWVNLILIFLVCIGYFMLICQNFYSTTAAVLQSISNYKPPTAKIEFGNYSIQYATLIAMTFTAPFIIRRDIDLLMKFFKITFYFVISYAVFIFAALIRVLADGALHFGEYRLFNPNFSTVAGTFALSFLIHPIAAPILKRNQNQANNPRDLLLGYGLAALIYAYIGFIGGLTCAESVTDILSPDTTQKYSTVFDCVIKGKSGASIAFYVIGKIVQFGIFLQNLSVMPILTFITRNQFLAIVPQRLENRAFVGFNMTLITLCLIITVFNVDVSIILSLNGAIIGFFMAYGIPIYSHLKCYHSKLSTDQYIKRSSLLLSQDTTDLQIGDQTREIALRCNDHPPRPLWRNLLIYGSMAIVGLALGIFKLISFFG